MRPATFASTIVIGAFLIAAAPARMRLVETCTQSECAYRTGVTQLRCKECRAKCAETADCDANVCAEACAMKPCDEGERTACASKEFAIVRPAADPALETACRHHFARAAECGADVEVEVDERRCRVYAAVERPEMARYYDCSAALGCEADGSACEPPPSTFGDEICEQLSNRCNGCEPEVQEALDKEGAWAREDALDVAEACAEKPCWEAIRCLKAWLHAVE